MCRSRRELSNEYLLAKIGVDTAENEPLEVWEKIIQYYSFVSLLGKQAALLQPHLHETLQSTGLDCDLLTANAPSKRTQASPIEFRTQNFTTETDRVAFGDVDGRCFESCTKGSDLL